MGPSRRRLVPATKAELLYADLGTQHYQHTFSPVITDVHLTETLFRFGINRHF